MTSHETLDRLMPGGLRLLQARSGYRYSLDTVLLARFVRMKNGCRIADLGTGSGVLPLLLARLGHAASIHGIELQEGLADRARRNVLLNDLQRRIEIVRGDIRNIRDYLGAGSMDLVVANPPYRRAGSGRIAPDNERAAARHELAGTLEDFVAAAGWLLGHGGRLAVVYPAERLPPLLVTTSAAGIEPKRLRMVHSQADEAARLVLVEGMKGARPGMVVEKPLIVYRTQGAKRTYSTEVEQMYTSEEKVAD